MIVAALLVFPKVLRTHPPGPAAQPLPGPPLRVLAARDGLRIGTAVDSDALRYEPGYRHDLAAQFSSLTPENAMKWSVLEPSRGDLSWAGADRIVAFALAHGQAVRGHTLVWWNQVPGWVQGLGRGALRAAMVTHIRALMTRYRGRVGTWDVVNEPLADDGRLRSDSVWAKLGAGYIPLAFRTARAADPRAALYLNEIGAEATGAKADALLALVRTLHDARLIDGVGLQAHFNTLHDVPPTFAANLRRFAAVGVQVAITEADVALKHPATPADLVRQAGVYGRIVGACRALRRACAGVTFWGFTDRHSWIPAASPGFGSADLLDSGLRAKPAFRAVQAALRG